MRRDVPRNYIFSPWLCVFLLFILSVVRISQYHLFPDSRVVAQAQRQYWSRIPINPNRGIITDRDGNVLALSVAASSYFIDSEQWKTENAYKLRGIFSDRVVDTLSKHRGGRFIWVARKIDLPADKKNEVLKLDGIFEAEEKQRVYPNNSLMAQTLGFCDIDDKGQAGIELAWDVALYEPPGYRIAAKRNVRMFEEHDSITQRSPIVNLTIDARIQHIVENALNDAVVVNAAKWGAAICLNPSTGEVLAMASNPIFNPNERDSLSNVAATVNNVVARTYEPGSTFKPIIMGISLEKGFVHENQVFKCPGTIRIADGTISEAYKKSFGNITPEEILIKSSNVGMAQIGIKARPVDMYHLLLEWGFGRTPGIELMGVERGLIAPPGQWRGVVPANIAIGQGIAVTPLQLAMGLSAVVNGGKLLKPYIVSSALNSEGNVVYTGERQVLRHVLTQATSSWLSRVMMETTIKGTGRIARTPVVAIGTKTGTAQVAEKGKYGEGRYVASIVGFWPEVNPQYLVLVVIGEPSKGKYYGGEIAGPPLRRIVEGIVDLYPVTVK